MQNKFQELINSGKIFDSHTHIYVEDFRSDLKDIVERADSEGVIAIVDMSNDYKSFLRSLEISNEFKNVYTGAGIHPEYCSDKVFNEKDELTQINEQIKNNKEKIVIIGEIGLDYYWLEKDEKLREHKEKIIDRQKELFKRMLDLAENLKLPVSIHTRDAVEDSIEISSNYDVLKVFHSITPQTGESGEQFSKNVHKIIDSGNYISINGIATYDSASIIRDTVLSIVRTEDKELTLQDFYDNHILFETDAPYLTPKRFKPTRNNRNEPASVVATFEYLKSLT